MEGFDGGEAGAGVLVDLGAAGIGGLPSRRNGAGFDGLDGPAHFGGMAPTGVEKEKGAAGIREGERRRVGGEQQMPRKIGFLAQGVGQEVQARRAAQGPDGALCRIFAATDDDENGWRHGGQGIRFGLSCKGLLSHNVPRLENRTWQE